MASSKLLFTASQVKVSSKILDYQSYPYFRVKHHSYENLFKRVQICRKCFFVYPGTPKNRGCKSEAMTFQILRAVKRKKLFLNSVSFLSTTRFLIGISCNGKAFKPIFKRTFLFFDLRSQEVKILKVRENIFVEPTSDCMQDMRQRQDGNNELCIGTCLYLSSISNINKCMTLLLYH